MGQAFNWENEPIFIEDANECWQVRAQAEKECLVELLASYHLIDIEHIGSTAVPGLAAKPIIDLMAKVKDFNQLEPIINLLQKYNWIHVPTREGEHEWRKYFIKIHNNKRMAHLHIVEEDSRKWDEHLFFRDTLRSSPTLVSEYAALKKKLAEQYSHDRELYTKNKSAFIQSVIKQGNRS
ncbi:GrpB family protein [Alkalicoccobacillus gibsonii]|uniref:GrpB family protein n=1 Tax=Alkalicoccobacillus gibsonii TaxID=79881 RepID=UPI003F7C1600